MSVARLQNPRSFAAADIAGAVRHVELEEHSAPHPPQPTPIGLDDARYAQQAWAERGDTPFRSIGCELENRCLDVAIGTRGAMGMSCHACPNRRTDLETPTGLTASDRRRSAGKRHLAGRCSDCGASCSVAARRCAGCASSQQGRPRSTATVVCPGCGRGRDLPAWHRRLLRHGYHAACYREAQQNGHV